MTEIKKKKGWDSGISGNPKGRPTGTGSVAKLRAVIEKRRPELLNVLMLKAMAGDVGAAKLLIERVLPPLRPTEQAQIINLPADGLTAQGQAILAAVASGSLAATQGAALIGAVVNLARVAEVDELAERIEALEKLEQA